MGFGTWGGQSKPAREATVKRKPRGREEPTRERIFREARRLSPGYEASEGRDWAQSKALTNAAAASSKGPGPLLALRFGGRRKEVCLP